MNEKLVAYLEKQIAERDAVLVVYDELIARKNALLNEVADVDAKIAEFGDLEAIKAERDELKGFIEPEQEIVEEVKEEVVDAVADATVNNVVL